MSDDFGEELVELEGGFGEVVGLGFLFGKKKKGFDEVAHALGGLLAGEEGFAIFFGGAVGALEQALGFGEENGDGGAKLVGGVGGELFLALEAIVEAFEGLVEDAAELVEFAVGAVGVDAFLKVAFGDMGGGATDGFDGTDGATGEPPATDEAEGPDAETESADGPGEAIHLNEFGGDVASDHAAQAGAGTPEGSAGVFFGAGVFEHF